jgi:hypothetical protein
MLYFFSGTDREKARAAMHKQIESAAHEGETARVTDTHVVSDFNAALQGGGMFSLGTRSVLFENVLQHEEMSLLLINSLEELKKSRDTFFVFEEKVDAATRKKIEKYAEKSERFDAPKSARDNTAFDMANALQRGDKKSLWVSYMRELGKGSAPEMLHGILFWAAKQHFLKSNGAAKRKAGHLLAVLTELPHEARRKDFNMEYALERFVLSVA